MIIHNKLVSILPHESNTAYLFQKVFKAKKSTFDCFALTKTKGGLHFYEENKLLSIQNLNDSKTRASPTSLVGGGIFILVTREWPLTRILVCQ